MQAPVHTRVTIMLARVTGVATLLMGLSLWRTPSPMVLQSHAGCAALMVLALWALAWQARRLAPGMALLAAAWGLLLPALGFAQLSLLPGAHHWVIQVLHLLVGLSALVQAERLAATHRRGERRVV